jgi:hypothetical protein
MSSDYPDFIGQHDAFNGSLLMAPTKGRIGNPPTTLYLVIRCLRLTDLIPHLIAPPNRLFQHRVKRYHAPHPK